MTELSLHRSPTDISSAPTCWPCDSCRAILPYRNRTDDGYIRTSYARIDIYPTFPGLKISADLGCSLCYLIWRTLRWQYENVYRFKPIENVPLTVAWDRNVKIGATFYIISFKFPSHKPIGVPPQFGGMVTTLSIGYEPVNGNLKDSNGTWWSGHLTEFSVFDSPGKLCFFQLV